MWQLERLAPESKRGEHIELDPTRDLVRVGRAEDADLRLYSATASRAHAELRRDDDGRWWIVPLEGCIVLADGETVDERCELCEGLCLVLGRDRLRCQTPTSEASTVAEPPPHRGPPLWHRPALWVASVLVLVVLFLRACG